MAEEASPLLGETLGSTVHMEPTPNSGDPSSLGLCPFFIQCVGAPAMSKASGEHFKSFTLYSNLTGKPRHREVKVLAKVTQLESG